MQFLRQAVFVGASRRELTIPWTTLSYLAVMLSALIPRVVDLGGFVTTDEYEHWLDRSHSFLRALGAQDYAATGITEHPGVTTMWLGSAGIVLHRALLAYGLLPDDSFAMMLALVRLPAAVVHVMAIMLGYAFLRRLMPALVAFVAAVLWAADPFVIAYSRVLHVDALAGTFATLSVLAACSYWNHAARRTALFASAVCAALSILSKLPGLTLVPTVALIALAAATALPRELRSRRIAGDLLLWSITCAITLVALWPALWTSPIVVASLIRDAIFTEGAAAHDHGNFFLGQPDPAPGPLFYPVALVLRLTPWTLGGLLLSFWAMRRLAPSRRRDVCALAAFAVCFMLLLTLFPKKFNRYLVPAFPALDILAAIGLLWGSKQLGRLLRRGGRSRIYPRSVTHAFAGGVVVAALINVCYWHPYSIAAFNQLFGGAAAGRWAFMAGWGEGLDQVGAWLNRQPDITRVLVVSPARPTYPLQPNLRAGVGVASTNDIPDNAGYAVLYLRDLQMPDLAPAFRELWHNAAPLHVVSIHGVPYAWIYQLRPPVATPREVDIGDSLRLRGFTRRDGSDGRSPLRLALFWEIRGAPPDTMLFVHVIGPGGKRYAQMDLALGLSDRQPGRFATTEAPPIALAPDAPAGTYHVTLGLYSRTTGRRLPVASGAAMPQLDGADAVLLTTIEHR